MNEPRKRFTDPFSYLTAGVYKDVPLYRVAKDVAPPENRVWWTGLMWHCKKSAAVYSSLVEAKDTAERVGGTVVRVNEPKEESEHAAGDV